MPSHLSFRFLHIIHARRFGFGTLEFPAWGIVRAMISSLFRPSPLGSDTMMVSGGVPDDDDILLRYYCCSLTALERRLCGWQMALFPVSRPECFSRRRMPPLRAM
jgi:hypothetical protein